MKIDNKIELIDEVKAPPMYTKIELSILLVCLSIFFLVTMVRMLNITVFDQLLITLIPFSYIIGIFPLFMMTYKTIRNNFIRKEDYFYRTHRLHNLYRFFIKNEPPVGMVKKITGKLAVRIGIVKLILIIPVWVYVILTLVYGILLND